MGYRIFLKRYFVLMNFSFKLLRNGNIFWIYIELIFYSEVKKIMNIINVYVILLCYKEKVK